VTEKAFHLVPAQLKKAEIKREHKNAKTAAKRFTVSTIKFCTWPPSTAETFQYFISRIVWRLKWVS